MFPAGVLPEVQPPSSLSGLGDGNGGSSLRAAEPCPTCPGVCRRSSPPGAGAAPGPPRGWGGGAVPELPARRRREPAAPAEPLGLSAARREPPRPLGQSPAFGKEGAGRAPLPSPVTQTPRYFNI